MDDLTVGALEPLEPLEAAPSSEMVRSEEHLRLDTRSEISGRVRISKRVVTEERVVTVTIRREELVVENMTIDGAPEPDLSSSPQRRSDVTTTAGAAPVLELLLSEEEVEVSTRVVPRERVRVFIDTVTSIVEVDKSLAREVIDIETSETPSSLD